MIIVTRATIDERYGNAPTSSYRITERGIYRLLTVSLLLKHYYPTTRDVTPAQTKTTLQRPFNEFSPKYLPPVRVA